MNAAQLSRFNAEFSPLSASFREGRFIARAVCSGCKEQEDWSGERMPSPDVGKTKFRTRGWDIGRRAICPACLSKPRKEAEMKPANGAKAPPPFDVKAALRLLGRVLDDEAYDHPNQRYKPGFTDFSLSKDTGLSVDAVAAERERTCGPIGEPPEIVGLKADLSSLQAEIAENNKAAVALCGRAEAIEEKLSAYCKKHGF